MRRRIFVGLFLSDCEKIGEILTFFNRFEKKKRRGILLFLLVGFGKKKDVISPEKVGFLTSFKNLQKMKKWHKLHPTRHGDVTYAVFHVIYAKGIDKKNFCDII